MRAEEIRGLSDGDLTGRIAEMEREQFNLRFKGGTQPLEDPLRLRALRKDIARLKTIQHERSLGLVRATPETAAPGTAKGKGKAKGKATKPAARKAAAKTAKTATAKTATAKAAAAKPAATKQTAAKTTTKRTTAKTPSKRAGGTSR